jgi:hypothetical protein
MGLTRENLQPRAEMAVIEELAFDKVTGSGWLVAGATKSIENTRIRQPAIHLTGLSGM